MSANFATEHAAGAIQQVHAETWAVLEMHFFTRMHLIDEVRNQLAECLSRLQAEGRDDPARLKDLACRAIQLKYGPAPAH